MQAVWCPRDIPDYMEAYKMTKRIQQYRRSGPKDRRKRDRRGGHAAAPFDRRKNS